MVQLLRLLCGTLIGLFQSSVRREAEILVLRPQINVLRRKSLNRPALNNADRSRAASEAEILVLRHQLNVLRRKSPKRLAFGNIDCLVFVGLYRLAPAVLDALKILKPQTVIRWHRAGFRAYWRWKSRPRGARP